MAIRPKATDTEEDLLAFQSTFLSSGERPAASLKRKAAGESSSMEGVRDVVRLSDEGAHYFVVHWLIYLTTVRLLGCFPYLPALTDSGSSVAHAFFS